MILFMATVPPKLDLWEDLWVRDVWSTVKSWLHWILRKPLTN